MFCRKRANHSITKWMRTSRRRCLSYLCTCSFWTMKEYYFRKRIELRRKVWWYLVDFIAMIACTYTHTHNTHLRKSSYRRVTFPFLPKKCTSNVVSMCVLRCSPSPFRLPTEVESTFGCSGFVSLLCLSAHAWLKIFSIYVDIMNKSRKFDTFSVIRDHSDN